MSHPAGRRRLAVSLVRRCGDTGDARSTPLESERTADLVAFLASGRGDALSGRFLHALDDVEALAARAEEIVRDDLYVARLRRDPL